MDEKTNLDVSVYQQDDLDYPRTPPFSPHTKYPEYLLGDLSDSPNQVYDAVRNALFLLGLDKNNFNTSHWNPLEGVVNPEDAVVIKPNFLLDRHTKGGDLFSIITHPSVLRAVVDYVYIALRGEGKIIIADSPDMACDFDNLLQETELGSIPKLYREEFGFKVDIYDLRNFWVEKRKEEVAYARTRKSLHGDPKGNVLVNLGKDSLFYEVENQDRFYGADYNRDETIKHHDGDKQEYLLSKTILSADVVISVPKLKVHRKVGVTLNTKGLVGMNVNKNYLIHYRIGTPSEGGDEFPDGLYEGKESVAIKLQRWARDKFLARKDRVGDKLYEVAAKSGSHVLRPLGYKIREDKPILCCGDWYGNDSAWRMAIDLLKVFFYADQNGELQDHPPRRMFSIVDGVIGGEGEGPLTPDSKRTGLIAAGFNPPAVDMVCTRLMGFEVNKIKILNYILEHPHDFGVDLQSIRIFSNLDLSNLYDDENKDLYFNFTPACGWIGHLEV